MTNTTENNSNEHGQQMKNEWFRQLNEIIERARENDELRFIALVTVATMPDDSLDLNIAHNRGDMRQGAELVLQTAEAVLNGLNNGTTAVVKGTLIFRN